MATHAKVYMTEITVITTFNQEGMNLYGQRFLDSFIYNVDKKIKLLCYAENCLPIIKDPQQVIVKDAKQFLPKLKTFKKSMEKFHMQMENRLNTYEIKGQEMHIKNSNGTL